MSKVSVCSWHEMGYGASSLAAMRRFLHESYPQTPCLTSSAELHPAFLVTTLEERLVMVAKRSCLAASDAAKCTEAHSWDVVRHRKPSSKITWMSAWIKHMSFTDARRGFPHDLARVAGVRTPSFNRKGSTIVHCTTRPSPQNCVS